MNTGSEQEHTSQCAVLVVDDDALQSATCLRLLREEGFTCEAVQSGEDAFARITSGAFDLVLIDVALAPHDGHAMIERARNAASQPAIIAMTSSGDGDRRLEALRAGGWGVVNKPLDPVTLSRTVAWALHSRAVSMHGAAKGHLEALYRMSTAVNTETELSAMLDRLLGTCAATLRADTGSVMLATSPSVTPRSLRVIASYGLTGSHPDSTIAFGERICGWVAENRRPLRLAGVPGGYPQFAGVSAKPEIAESLVAPIEFRQEVLGTISLGSKVSGTFGPEALLFLVSAAELAAASIYRDRMVRRNEHHDRLALFGQLSVSVAHELNNPLSYVRANLNDVSCTLEHAVTAGALFDARNEMIESLNDASEGVARMVSLADSLRTSARKSSDTRQVIDPNALLLRAQRMVAAQVKHQAEVFVECQECPMVWADPNRILQVLINLLLNAAHAVGKRGRIVLRSRPLRGGAAIDVCDNGGGIAPEVAPRLFEPFFSTKPEGEGTGLGLSISRQIATAHGGTLTYTTELGKGTTFSLALPTARVDAEVRPTVLVVDDEESIVRAISRLLRRECVVLSASSAEEGLAASHHHRLDLIITDFAMPHKTGIELVRALREQGQTAPAVLITPMTNSPEVLDVISNGLVTAVIRKPWPSTIVDDVLRLIGRAPDRKVSPPDDHGEEFGQE